MKKCLTLERDIFGYFFRTAIKRFSAGVSATSTVELLSKVRKPFATNSFWYFVNSLTLAISIGANGTSLSPKNLILFKVSSYS